MLRSAFSGFTRVFDALISAFTRVFDALWRCAADPESIVSLALLWVPALRSSVKHAAPRPGHERNLLSPCSDLPVGRLACGNAG